MNKKTINRILLILLLLVVFSSLYGFFMNKEEPILMEDDNSKLENIEKDYSSFWIDPNKYEKIEDFLDEYKSFTWSKLDISENNFVICNINEDGTKEYIPFYHSRINNGMFDDKDDKNEAIVDIYSSHISWCLHGWIWSQGTSKIIFEQDIAHSESKTLWKVFWKESNMNDMVTELEGVKNLSIEKKELLWYLYELKWDYEKSSEKRTQTCSENDVTCWIEQNIKIYGKVLDDNSQPIEWALVTLLNDRKNTSETNSKWEYNITIKHYPFSHLRLKAYINWYSDWFNTLSFNTYRDSTWEKEEHLDFTLNKADKTYTDITSNYKDIVTRDWKQYYVFTSSQSKYFVPLNWLHYIDDSEFRWESFDVHLYEFSKWDNTDNLTNVDTFSPASWYVWNLMKTFWMPYIQFVDSTTKKEIFVKKSNPMVLQNNIYHMKELYENYDKIYEAITDDDMSFLVTKSSELGWYPIDFDFLVQNNFLKWPAWWVLDRKKWIWESVPSKVLTVEWLVELPFYSIN